MDTFRDASIGVWCISWHPPSGDLVLERLRSVLRNNLLASEGQHKAVLLLLGHVEGDMLGLRDASASEHHGMTADEACRTYADCWRHGLTPGFFPVCIESPERWRWMLSV